MDSHDKVEMFTIDPELLEELDELDGLDGLDGIDALPDVKFSFEESYQNTIQKYKKN
jgi:hypothetical protein